MQNFHFFLLSKKIQNIYTKFLWILYFWHLNLSNVNTVYHCFPRDLKILWLNLYKYFRKQLLNIVDFKSHKQKTQKGKFLDTFEFIVSKYYTMILKVKFMHACEIFIFLKSTLLFFESQIKNEITLNCAFTITAFLPKREKESQKEQYPAWRDALLSHNRIQLLCLVNLS